MPSSHKSSRPKQQDQAPEDSLGYYARLRRGRAYLLQHISEPLSAEEAARIADLSPNYFSTYFRERVGMSYTQWSHALRVQFALEMMRTSDVGISEVAGGLECLSPIRWIRDSDHSRVDRQSEGRNCFIPHPIRVSA